MKKITLQLTHEEVNLMFCICDHIGKWAKEPDVQKLGSDYVLILLIAEKAVDLHKRTYVFGNNKKKVKLVFKMSEAAALRQMLKNVKFNSSDVWNATKRDEFISIFDRALV